MSQHRTPRAPVRGARPGVALLTATALVGGTMTASGVLAQEASLERDPQAPVGDAGIRVPDGFRAQVVADDLGPSRHIAVRDNGDLYVALDEPREGGVIAALRDEDGDGSADTMRTFGDHGVGTGIAIHDGWLYASSDTAVYRYSLPEQDLVPESEPEVVVDGFPEQESHASKAFSFDQRGNLYVNVGAPSNACQEEDRTPGSPGQDPCPLLERHAGIWRFDAEQTGQSFDDGERFLTGTRNIVALDWRPSNDELYFVMHGRDQLHDLFPDLYTVEESTRLPAEELHVAREGANYGWPYTYWDGERGERMLAPEYGGDGETLAESGTYEDPHLAFPAHWAPNDLLFYEGGQFPQAFEGGAFIAFHGSWNRAPVQEGYNVVFVPFEGANPAGEWHVFADGFKGTEELVDSDDAERRAMGLAQGPDGELYITDSVHGRIWRVSVQG